MQSVAVDIACPGAASRLNRSSGSFVAALMSTAVNGRGSMSLVRTSRAINEGILMEAHLDGRHHDTLQKIFEPANHNIEWREVVSLLEAVGDFTQEHNGKLKVSLGPETEVLSAPHGKDVDVQTVVDLRRMLTQAGLAPEGSRAVADQHSRDHGDGRWGEPT
jgi:hypothetical protein